MRQAFALPICHFAQNNVSEREGERAEGEQERIQ